MTIYLNTSEFVGFVWGPLKFLLLTASSYSAAFDGILGMYETIGLNLPQLQQYESLFHTNPQMRTILHSIYTDVLRFHRKALKFFKQRVWKQVFQATWKGMQAKFERIIDSFKSHKSLLESQANLIEFAEHRKFLSEQEANYRRQKFEEEQRKRTAVRAWLSPANTAEDQENFAQERAKYPETGKWLLADSRILTVTSTPLLWLTGIPGAGKTTLASLVIETLRQQHSLGCILFFYCKHGDQNRNSFVTIACSLLGQLLRYNKTLLPHFYECAVDSETASLTSISECQTLLSLAPKSLPRVYLIIDGVDECPAEEARKIISWFKQETDAINGDSGDARCLFVSQDDQVCRRLLRETPTIKISKEDNRDDIRAYCNSLSQTWIDDFEISDKTREETVEKIVTNASGMFLFAKLVILNLCDQMSRGDFLEEISSKVLPRGLDEAYGRIVSGVLCGFGARSRYATKVLRWLICAKRSLKWHEVQGAISIDLKTRTIDFQNRKLSMDLKQLCGSLIEIRANGSIELVHPSAKLYLLDHKYVVESQETLEFCKLCMGYLSHPSVDHRLGRETLKTYVVEGYYAFFDYAVAYWAGHLEDCLGNIKSYDPDTLLSLKKEALLFLDRHVQEDCCYPISSATKLKMQPFKTEYFYNDLSQSLEYWKHENTMMGMISDALPALDFNAVITTVRSAIEVCSTKQPLQQFYGERLFKCDRPWCNYFSDGFGDPSLQEQHKQEHERSFCCSYPSCPASMVGFPTKKDLDLHVAESHNTTKEWADVPSLSRSFIH